MITSTIIALVFATVPPTIGLGIIYGISKTINPAATIEHFLYGEGGRSTK